jgi:hypothetical protein
VVVCTFSLVMVDVNVYVSLVPSLVETVVMVVVSKL